MVRSQKQTWRQCCSSLSDVFHSDMNQLLSRFEWTVPGNNEPQEQNSVPFAQYCFYFLTTFEELLRSGKSVQVNNNEAIGLIFHNSTCDVLLDVIKG